MKTAQLQNLGLRFAGSLIDTLLLLFLVVPAAMILGIVLSLSLGEEGVVSDWIANIVGGVFAILSTLAIHGYLLATRGQTVGKWLLGMKIVSDNGQPLSFPEMFLKRYVFMILISLIPVVGYMISLADALMIFRSSRKCLHDDFAQTHVIKLPPI